MIISEFKARKINYVSKTENCPFLLARKKIPAFIYFWRGIKVNGRNYSERLAS